MANISAKDASGATVYAAAQGAGSSGDPYRPGRSVADGDDVAQGATSDAIVAAGATGSVSAKLRRVTQGLEDLKSLIVLAAGSNTIGTVGVTSQPARAATTDAITAKLATDALQNGTTALTPKFASISCSSSGDNTIVSSVASKKLRVLAYTLMASGSVNAKWRSNTTDKTGLLYLAGAGYGASPPFNPLGHFETAAGEALNLNLSGATAVGGHLTYVEV
jgi:hypothetical protein